MQSRTTEPGSTGLSTSGRSKPGQDDAELGTIEREIYVAASPEVVFDVVSRPEHVREWWSDDADLDPTPGATGELVFGDRASGSAQVETLTVVAAEPPRLFSFRWVADAGVAAAAGNSLLVTFELVPTGEGTTIRLRESGFRERGWEAAVLEAAYQEHVEGWDYFVPRLGAYVERLASTP